MKHTQNGSTVYSVGKMLICGNVIEHKKYDIPVYCDRRKKWIPKEHKFRERHKDIDSVKRVDNLYRARARVRQLVWCNLTEHSKFLTLTTADTVLDIKVFKRRLTSFFQAMKREGYKLRYLGVYERQESRGLKEGNSGSIHCHLIIFNDEYIPFEIINKHWKGITDIHMLNGLKYNSNEKIRDAGAYICKYITKESSIEWGSHCYFTSLGLNKPVEFSQYVYINNETGSVFTETYDDLFKTIIGDSLLNYSNMVQFPMFNDTEKIQTIFYEQYTLNSKQKNKEENIL